MENSVNRTKHDEIMKALKERGFRMTKQRDLIVSAILEKTCDPVPPGIQEILSAVLKKDPSIGMATVYRTVEVLANLGFLNLVDQGDGFKRMTLSQGKISVHAFCRRCGRSVPIPFEEKEKIIQSLSNLSESGKFTLLPQAFRICGLCRDCQESHNPEGMGCRCMRRRRLV